MTPIPTPTLTPGQNRRAMSPGQDPMPTTWEGEFTDRPKRKNFLLNPDNKGLMTYISSFRPQFNCVFGESNAVC